MPKNKLPSALAPTMPTHEEMHKANHDERTHSMAIGGMNSGSTNGIFDTANQGAILQPVFMKTTMRRYPANTPEQKMNAMHRVMNHGTAADKRKMQESCKGC